MKKALFLIGIFAMILLAGCKPYESPDKTLEKQLVACFEVNMYDYEKCIGHCNSNDYACYENVLRVWDTYLNQTMCVEWNKGFQRDIIDQACSSTSQNNTCKWSERGDVTIHWGKYDRYDTYICSKRNYLVNPELRAELE
jgi:hypothetical protein